MAQCQRAEEQLQIPNASSEPTLPTGTLETAWQVTPPPGFLGVMACLQRDPLPVDAYKALLDPL